MNCRQCGAQIRRENKIGEDRYQCPGCGKVYRVKPKAPAAPEQPVKKPEAKKLPEIQLSRKTIFIAAAALAVIVIGVVLALTLGGRDRVAVEAPVATVEPTAAPTVEPTPAAVVGQPATAHIRAVGDVMSHKLQLTHAKQKDGSYNYDSQFALVKDALSKADYTIANLELSIAVDSEYSSYPRFRTPEAILDTLKDCGVDMLTLANNHILDGFYDGLVKTVNEAEERGFDHVGADRTKEESQQPTIVDINGIRFGFLAYTVHLNENDKRLDSETAAFCVKRLADADFEEDVKQLREAGAEVVVCLPHWGTENKRSVSSECKTYAQAMVDAGVDIILGSHPHVVLPIFSDKMEVQGEEKDILVAWSMGNFISYMANQYVDSGIIVDFSVSRDEQGRISIHDVGYVPVYVCGSKEYFRLVCSGDFYSEKPDGMSNSDYKRMKESVKEISSMIGQDGLTMLQN